MKHILLLVLLCLGMRPAGAQVPWTLAVALGASAGNANSSQVVATATDASGNVFVGGYFSGTIALGGATLTSAGGADVFVAKWNPAQAAFVWAQRAGGPQPDVLTGLAVAGTGVYLTGTFGGTADFGPSGLTSAGGQDIFVAKLTDAGSSSSFTWAQRAGGAGYETASALAVNGASVYVAGQVLNVPAAFGSFTIASAGLSDLYVAKLTDAGSSAAFTWVQRAGGAYNAGASALAVSGQSVYVAGGFNGGSPSGSSMLFGTISLTTLTSYGAGFVAKITDAGASGSFTWVQKADGLETAIGGLAVSGASVYAAGYFNYGVQLGDIHLTSAGDYDTFVAKLTDAGASGSYVWAQRAGGSFSTEASSVAAVGGAVYVSGAYTGSPAFGGTVLTNASGPQVPTYPRFADVFAAKLIDNGPSGSFAWAKGAGGALDDGARGIAASGPYVYVGGFVTPAATFDNRPINSPAGYAVGFLAALFDALPPALSALAPTSGPTNTTAVTLTGTNLTGALYVTFNGTPATKYTVNHAGNQLIVTVPDGATTGLVAVTTPVGTATSAGVFTVTGQGPLITDLSPAFARTGQTITVSGAHLAAATGVTFSGVAQPAFAVNAAGTQLTAAVPAGGPPVYPALTSGPVRVSTAAGDTASSPAPLRLLALTDASSGGYPGGLMVNTVALTGSGFVGSSVRFVLAYPVPVSYPAAFTVVDETHITATVPDVSGTTAQAPDGVWVVAHTPGEAYSNYQLLSPVVSTIAPVNAPAGTVVTVTGFNFQRIDPRPFSPFYNQSTAITGFSFNGVAGTNFQLLGPTGTFAQMQARITVPPGLSPPVYVQATGGALQGGGVIMGYLYTGAPLPVLGIITPGSGARGSMISLSGTNLSGTTLVSFGGTGGNTVAGGFAVNMAGTLLSGLIVPAGAATGPVTVTTPGGTSNALPFTVSTATAVQATTLAPYLRVYPNPAHTTVTVVPGPSSGGAELTLYDPLGRAVRRFPLPPPAGAELDLRGLPAGLYRLQSGAGGQRLQIE